MHINTYRTQFSGVLFSCIKPFVNPLTCHIRRLARPAALIDYSGDVALFHIAAPQLVHLPTGSWKPETNGVQFTDRNGDGCYPLASTLLDGPVPMVTLKDKEHGYRLRKGKAAHRHTRRERESVCVRERYC